MKMSEPVPVRTWCCNTPADGPHREGCDFEPREDNPVDYGGPFILGCPHTDLDDDGRCLACDRIPDAELVPDLPTVAGLPEGCICPGPTVTDTSCPVHQKKPLPRLDAEQIREIAQGIVAHEYFVGSTAPVDLWPMIFMPIGLGGLADYDLDTLGNVVEKFSRAGDRGINGFPMFLSCVPIHRDDWAVIVEWVQKLLAAMSSGDDEMAAAASDEPVKPVEK
jgi:hypothetical protein